MTGPQKNLMFVIGEEKRLAEIVGKAEIEPLLRSGLKAGLVRAALLDEDHLPICGMGDDRLLDGCTEIRYPLLVEGEPRGQLVVAGRPAGPATEALAVMLRDVLQLTLNNNLKRMLTTEAHTCIVQESYEQLLETNVRLTESEARYRDLAMTLERKIGERTVELQKAYARMLQQEKLASIGQLAAGMAHEINNPTGFILSNLKSFRKYSLRLKEMLDLFRLLGSKDTTIANLHAQTEARWRELKIDFVLKDIEELITQSMEGAGRIAQIVANLKGFSHVDQTVSVDIDLNTELERTLSVVAPQLPADALLIRSFAPLPPVRCNPALLCQAFFGILQNSVKSRGSGLELRISTAWAADRICVAITDNGCGIAPENLERIFDPFFTTRDVGEGTGMGLTVVREIIVSCGGTIEVESIVGSGTTVILQLPVAPEER